jgi:hypothetical protein
VWIERGGKRMSTLDLFGRDFVLLAGFDAEVWCNEAATVAEHFHTRIDVVRLAEHRALGLRANGALLVRPDGIVAWRSKRGDPTIALTRAFAQILGKDAPSRHLAGESARRVV